MFGATRWMIQVVQGDGHPVHGDDFKRLPFKLQVEPIEGTLITVVAFLLAHESLLPLTEERTGNVSVISVPSAGSGDQVLLLISASLTSTPTPTDLGRKLLLKVKE